MTIDIAITQETEDVGLDATAPSAGGKRRFLFLRNRKAITGMVILGFFLLIAVIGPWIAPYDPSARSEDILQPPSWEHLFGTTHLGQDVFSQILVGTRGVMVVGLVAGAVATFIGVVVGVTAGYIGGVGDESLSLVANVFQGIEIELLAGVSEKEAPHREALEGLGKLIENAEAAARLT